MELNVFYPELVYLTYIMPPISKKLRGHWFGPVRLLRFAHGQERLEMGSWNLICEISIENKQTSIFLFSVGLVVAEICLLFYRFSTFA